MSTNPVGGPGLSYPATADKANTMNTEGFSEAVSTGVMQALGGRPQELTFPNGDKYVGQVRDGRPHGQGTYFYGPKDEKQRNRCEGNFANGMREGRGETYYKKGAYYTRITGGYKNDTLEGYGEAEMSAGDIYKGNWEKGFWSGQGTLHYAPANEWNLTRYEGGFLNGKRHGRGVLTWVNNSMYRGEFADGTCAGQGKKEWRNGEYEEGTYQKGVLWSGKRYIPIIDHHGARTVVHTVRNGKSYFCCGLLPTCTIV